MNNIFKLSVLIVFGLTVLVGSDHVKAIEPTPAETTENNIIDKIKQRLDKETSDLSQNIDEANLYFGYFGIIIDYQNNTLTLQNNDTKHQVMLNEKTAINKTTTGLKKTIEPDELTEEKDGFALAVGKKTDSGFVAEKISIFKQPEPAKKRTVTYGTILESDNTQIKISQTKQEKTLSLNNQTTIFLANGTILTPEDILIDDQMVSVCQENKDTITAIVIMIIPGRNNPLAQTNQINASESAGATVSAQKE